MSKKSDDESSKLASARKNVDLELEQRLQEAKKKIDKELEKPSGCEI